MGSSGSKKKVQMDFPKEDITKDACDKGEVKYRKNYNLAQGSLESDYDDEVDSYIAGEEDFGEPLPSQHNAEDGEEDNLISKGDGHAKVRRINLKT